MHATSRRDFFRLAKDLGLEAVDPADDLNRGEVMKASVRRA
jgi:hypothetical protein